MEKYQVSTNLIDQVQILLKKEAGFESFNYDDHSLDSLPSSFLNEAIVGSNPSVDVLRCKDCKGVLLRGSDSIICVYCGHSQLHDFLPNPISFKSTSAFQWFLQSLGLDGFESVVKPIGGIQSGDKGQSSFKGDEIPLSDFLDLQLNWPDDVKGFGVKNEEQLPGKRYLSLVGIDIEELLSQENTDHASSVKNQQAISQERSLNLFESEAALTSGEGENDKSYSDWGAEFQSAFPNSGPETSANSLVSGAPSRSNVTTSGNDNLWSNVESGAPFNLKVSDGKTLVEGGGKALESTDASIDWLPADQRHDTSAVSLNSDNIDADDSFDEWGDFRMSVSDKITHSEPNSTTMPATDSNDGLVVSDSFNGVTESIVSKNFQNNTFTVPDDAWNNFVMPTSGGDVLPATNSNKQEEQVGTGDPAVGGKNDLALFDVSFLEHQGIHVESAHKKISDQGDSIGLWSSDTNLGSKGNQLLVRESEPPASGTTIDLDNSFDLWNGFKSSDNPQQATNMAVADGKISTEGGSTFNAWNGFSGLGIGKKEEASSLEVVGGKGNGNQSNSSALWNDNSLDVWSDFSVSTGVSESKPIDNDISSGAWNDFSSLMVTHANLPETSHPRTFEDQAVHEDDNLFDSWSEFHSSGVNPENSSLGPNDTKSNSDKISFHKAPNSLKTVEDNSNFSSWGDIGVATSVSEQQEQAAGVGASECKLSSVGVDFLSGLNNGSKQSTSEPDNHLQCDGVTMLDGKSMCQNDDLFDAWTDFTSSTNAQADVGSSVNAPDDKEAVKRGDLLDAWNVVDSSPNVQAGKDTAVAMGTTPEVNLFGPNMNSQYVGPNSSLHPDIYVGTLSPQNGSAPIAFTPPEVSGLAWTEHGDVKADGNIDRINPSESTSMEALDLKSSVAETLISEMHDLSFMLESNLSIPNRGTQHL